jgi:hypothetical protein
VIHVCNPTTGEAAEIRRIMIGGQPEQNVWETPSQPIGGHGGACHPNFVGSVNRRILVHASLGIKRDPTGKMTKVKRARVWLMR